MQKRLAERGARLDVVRGAADRTILALAEAADAARVLWTRRYEGAAMALDAGVKAALRERGVEGLSFNGRLMREPWELARADGAPAGDVLRLLAPPSRARRAFPAAACPRRPERGAVAGARAPARPDRGAAADPDRARLVGRTRARRDPGRGRRPRGAGAFCRRRDCRPTRPGATCSALDATSRLSAHLRFGEISARRAAAAAEAAAAADPRLAQPAEKYLAELGWRDFAAALLTAHPDMAERPLRREFERFPWRDDRAGFRAWTRGETGYPIVDAGMRQLWRTGFMHNRVRMIAASFLVKHLLIDWRRGEEWFWDTLCDADPASNPQNWQWVAGCGVDAAPYFRIFNPVLQGEKFDPDGAYVRRWVPELAQARGAAYPCAVEGAGAALARAGVTSAGPIRGRSSTMPPPAPGRSPPSRKYAARGDDD